MTYKDYIGTRIVSKLPELAKEHDQVYYLYDTINDQAYYSELFEEWLSNEEFLDSLNTITKSYGFFRSLIDYGIDQDELVQLGKFLVKNNIVSATEIKKDNDLFNKFKEDFKTSDLKDINFEDNPFYLPDDLMDSLGSIRNGVVLVGGGVNECLKEIRILLEIMGINHSINPNFTY